MRTSHKLLLRLFHDPAYSFAEVEVRYVDRGAPGDESGVSGGDIAHLDRDYIEISTPLAPGGTTAIPYHRIRRIFYKGQVVWDRVFGECLPEGVER
ncbi:MAG: hypothetical protein APR53_02405 [Methanoculleus sp. SDB]|nr:MAG: hypothetical protein APR53_02405 [Methanoculleus sp. SDB]